MANFLLLNGPNLNMLGTREPSHYGSFTLPQIEDRLLTLARQQGHQLSCYQSNAEHELIQKIHAAKSEQIDMIMCNAGAYTHTSIALRDAFLSVNIPFIEVHLSNIHARESFRHHSYLADIAKGVIYGFGPFSYELALQAAIQSLEASSRGHS